MRKLIKVVKQNKGWTLQYEGSSEYWLKLDLDKFWYKYKKDAQERADELNRSYDLK
jgi:hypothetical protein